MSSELSPNIVEPLLNDCVRCVTEDDTMYLCAITSPTALMLPLTSKEEPVIVPVTVRFVEVTSVLLNVVVLNVFDSNLPKEPVEVDEPLTLPANSATLSLRVSLIVLALLLS